jgi:hypothetical protein
VPVSRTESILGAEVAAIASLLDGFDSRTTRVGPGELRGRGPARRQRLVSAAHLRPPAAQGPRGPAAGRPRGRNQPARRACARAEVSGHAAPGSRRQRGATPGGVDGRSPTAGARSGGGAIRAARSLAKRGVRVHVFEIGGGLAAAVAARARRRGITHGERATTTSTISRSSRRCSARSRLRAARAASRTFRPATRDRAGSDPDGATPPCFR